MSALIQAKQALLSERCITIMINGQLALQYQSKDEFLFAIQEAHMHIHSEK